MRAPCPGPRFDAVELRERARTRLHRAAPAEASDLTLTAPRGDDDLNVHLPASGAAGPGRAAAVLVPLVRREMELTVLLTLRSDHLPSHGGQIAFPGGKIDEVDDGPLEAALREAHEETGLDPRLVEPLGYLDVYQTRTGFRIIPVVGLVDPSAQFSPGAGEVADVFEVPLSFLMDPLHHLQESRLWQGVERRFYVMAYGERYIWGATAGMLRNLYDRLYAR
ncbi:MAG TPA: CoA pyrophosphatase [Aestuariivirgaceae bacterium]|nr:CoA pyrophosphatase [Aestuariivirgaceae bacterium]